VSLQNSFARGRSPVRAFDAGATMTGYELVEGAKLEDTIARCLPMSAPPICMSISPRAAATPPASGERERDGACSIPGG
jgi:hypothetical protein